MLEPPRHAAFHDVDTLLDFVESLAELSGLPIGIKSAVGQMAFWEDLARKCPKEGVGSIFVTIDGGEGGTGAAPLVFSDHVALPFKQGFSRVYQTFHRHGLCDKVVFWGAGKLGFPDAAITAFALGCDGVMLAREAMLSIGCIQAQHCHTGNCPAGVATQSKWLMRGLDPQDKSARLAQYLKSLRKEILRVCHSAGVAHPALMDSRHIEISDGQLGTRTLEEVYGFPEGSRRVSPSEFEKVTHWMNSLSGEGFPLNPCFPKARVRCMKDPYLQRADEVFAIEMEALEAVRQSLGSSFGHVVASLVGILNQRGKIVVVGVGKSGNIGRKIAATLTKYREHKCRA